MKDIQYLTHDLGARNDPKLMDLQMDMSGQGLGIFWCLVEMLWENDGFIPANYKSIAFALRWCKPAEVERVVTGYGLFQVENGMITSHSAIERIKAKQAKFKAHSDAGRIGAGRRWNGNPNSNANGGANGNPNGDAMAAPMPITNLLTNKQKDINNNIPPTADFLFEIFLFRNLKEPGPEAHRFLKHYTDSGWTYTDGTPVTDYEKAAEAWKPAKPGRRFPEEALNWYRAVWYAARDRVKDSFDIFLSQLTGIRMKGNAVALVYRTEGAARTVSSFVMENDLAGDYIIDYRIDN